MILGFIGIFSGTALGFLRPRSIIFIGFAFPVGYQSIVFLSSVWLTLQETRVDFLVLGLGFNVQVLDSYSPSWYFFNVVFVSFHHFLIKEQLDGIHIFCFAFICLYQCSSFLCFVTNLPSEVLSYVPLTRLFVSQRLRRPWTKFRGTFQKLSGISKESITLTMDRSLCSTSSSWMHWTFASGQVLVQPGTYLVFWTCRNYYSDVLSLSYDEWYFSWGILKNIITNRHQILPLSICISFVPVWIFICCCSCIA